MSIISQLFGASLPPEFDPAVTPDRRPSITEAGKAAVKEVLNAIPDGKKQAIVVVATKDDVRAHFARKFGDVWKVSLEGGRKWNGETSGTATIVGTW